MPTQCGPLPSFIYEDYLRHPIDEGRNQFYYAWMSKKDCTILPDLANRAAHVIEGVILFVPIVNLIALRIFQYFELTFNQALEKAVKSGDEKGVEHYIKFGLDPKALASDGEPLLFHAKKAEVVEALIKGGTNPATPKGDGTLFLEYLAKNGMLDLATDFVNQDKVDCAPYLERANALRLINDKASWTLLLRMGYQTWFFNMRNKECKSKTDSKLEPLLLSGNIEAIYLFIMCNGFEGLEKELQKIQTALPKLHVDWIWRELLIGACSSSGQYDEELIRKILQKNGNFANLNIGDISFLQYLVDKNKINFATKLVQDELVDPTPYLTPEAFIKAKFGGNTYPTFLIHIGHRASPETRSNDVGYVVTNLELEKIIVSGDTKALETLMATKSLKQIDDELAKIKEAIPLLYTDWIWKHIFEGCCKNQIEITDETALTLIQRGADVNSLRTCYDLGTDFVPKLIETRESLAMSLVNKGLINIDPYFKDSYLGLNNSRITKKPAPFIWFLIKTGYPKSIEGQYNYTYQKRPGDNLLEEIILTCDRRQLISLFRNQSLAKIIKWYQELQQKYPRLNTPWVWETLAKGFFRTNRIEDIRYLVNNDYYYSSDSLYGSNPHGCDIERRKLLMELGYSGKPLLSAVEANIGTLLGCMHCQDADSLKNLAKLAGFENFCNKFHEIMAQHPKMQTGWMWNVLFKIPQSHYDQFKPIKASETLTKEPPGDIAVKELKGLFHKIDFRQISRSKLTDTLDNCIHTKSSLETNALNKILGSWSGPNRAQGLAYNVGASDAQKHILELKWIIHYFKEDLKGKTYLSKGKAHIFIEMLIECMHCSSNWNEVFPRTRKRLSGEKISKKSFEDHMQSAFANRRSLVIDKIVEIHKNNDAYDTHMRENLVSHLEKVRALNEKPSRDRLHDYKFNKYSDAIKAFDIAYTSREMFEALIEQTGADSDFCTLFKETPVVLLAPKWRKQDQAFRDLVKTRGENGSITYDELEKFGCPYETETPLFEEIWPFLTKLNWGPLVSFPIAKLQENQESAHETVKADAKTRSANETPLSAAWMNELNISRGTLNEVSIPRILAALSQHLECQDQTLKVFYQNHPEIPDSLKKQDFINRKLIDKEVKEHLMTLAFDLKYKVSPDPISIHLENKEKDLFGPIAIPLKENEKPIFKEEISPLILGMLLVDMKHLECTIPGFFNNCFLT